jgi:hypothetical protein
MTDQLRQRNLLVKSMLRALGNVSVAAIVEDLALAGPDGQAIRSDLALSGASRSDCKSLISKCCEYPKGMIYLYDVLKGELDGKAAWPDLHNALLPFVPSLDLSSMPSLPASMAGSSVLASPGVYISYAWGDSTPEGQRRGQLVTDLCAALKAAGITVLIDHEQVKPGARISSFMHAIGRGDAIIVILSDKYLESEYCVYELNAIWKESRQDPDHFLGRVIPLTLPDANLKLTKDLLARRDYWSTQWKLIKELIVKDPDATGIEIFVKCKDIQQFSQQIADILALLNDKCEPRDFDRQADEGFSEVIEQIRRIRGE